MLFQRFPSAIFLSKEKKHPPGKLLAPQRESPTLLAGKPWLAHLGLCSAPTPESPVWNSPEAVAPLPSESACCFLSEINLPGKCPRSGPVLGDLSEEPRLCDPFGYMMPPMFGTEVLIDFSGLILDHFLLWDSL